MTPAGSVNHLKQVQQHGVASLYTNLAGSMTASDLNEWIANTIRSAQEDGDDDSIKELAAIMLSRGEILPAAMQEFVVGYLKGPMPVAKKASRGPNPRSNAVRDIVIRRTVAWIAKRYDLKPTKNAETSTAESGCSIVTAALARVGIHMQEKTIEKIWDSRPKN